MKLSFISLALIAALSWLHAADTADTIVLDENRVKNLRIETVEAEETDFEETIFALGRIAEIPQRHAVVSSRIPGRVIGLDANEGDSVKAEQVLVRVESRQPGNPPPVIELRAPIDGLVVESHVRLGEPVEPDKELLDISDLSEVYAIARVPEHHAGQLKPGSKAHIMVSALGDQIIEGEMLRFGTSADHESGTIDAVFRVANPGLKMRPDMRAEFSIVLSKRSNVIGIPRAALQGDASQRFVYVRHFDLPNAFIKTPVQVGQMNDRNVEILSGLFPADDVVTKGAYSLSFAGGGNGISLREALDAAHGHEHAEDGSELTPEKRAEMEARKRATSGSPPETRGGRASRVWEKEALALSRGIRLEAEAARAEMKQWADVIREINHTLLPLAEEQAALAETTYRNGQGEIQSVLRSREKRLELSAAKLDALREFHLARVRHEAALGNL